MKKIFFGTLAVCSLAAMAQIVVPVMKTGKQTNIKIDAPAPVKALTERQQIKLYTSDAPFKANFSLEGAEAALEPVYTYNFDNGFQGWTTDPTQHVEWSLKASPSSNPFSQFDPADVQSLFVDGDYRGYNREKSGATSPVLTIPENASLNFYTYFSLNFDYACRLELSLSSDGFEDENIVLWNSGDESGEKTACWHPVAIDLSPYAGKTVQFKLLYTYGSDDEIFKTGGYLGNFYIDGFTISALKSVEHIDVMTGDKIYLKDITDGDIVAWEWSMPGATPATSNIQNPVIYYTDDGDYDISLTVTDAAGNADTKTVTNFVSVTGTEPIAKINLPATFRLSTNRLPLVAPLAPVTFSDGSDGFPNSHNWTITGVDQDLNTLFTSTEEAPKVSFSYLHDQKVTLEVANRHGKSSAEADFTVEYGGVINNLLPTDGATNFDMSDWGVFPGSNTQKFTKYAERFSKPSRPVMVPGAYIFFNNADAGDLVDQISNVGVHLYTSKDGLPDKCLDSWWWSVYELDTQDATGATVGTPFPFTYNPFVDDEFFIVIDGIPAFSEATADTGRTLVSFLMAPFRESGNTALFYDAKKEKWIEANEYFGAARHTSFYVMPAVYHSVMAPLTNNTGELTVGKEAGTAEFQIFSYLGRTATPEIDCDWLRITSAPGEYTVDTLKIAYDKLPEGVTDRMGHITLTDGASKLTLRVIQNGETASIDTAASASSLLAVLNDNSLRVEGCDPEQPVMIFAINGTILYNAFAHDGTAIIDTAAWAPGIYVIINGNNSFKFIK